MLTIRNAKPSDIKQIHIVNPLVKAEVIGERLRKQSKREAEYLVLDNGIHLLGQIFLKWTGKPTHPEYPDIENIYVKASERGKGYGTLLVTECERRAKIKGYKKIGLAVNHVRNCPEQILFRKLGYIHDGKIKYPGEIASSKKGYVIDMEKDIL